MTTPWTDDHHYFINKENKEQSKSVNEKPSGLIMIVFCVFPLHSNENSIIDTTWIKETKSDKWFILDVLKD